MEWLNIMKSVMVESNFNLEEDHFECLIEFSDYLIYELTITSEPTSLFKLTDLV